MIDRCLVIVPHQDDETMLAGYLISAMRKKGVEVFVLYSTNGDWKYPADLRIKEAARANRRLGDIDEGHIILLGYGDTYNNEAHTHYYYAGSEPARSAAGHRETYGAHGISDYRYAKSGHHSPYTRQAYISDIKDVISDLMPDMMVCVDFDEHPDHRMLTLGFETALGQVLAEHRTYHPIVLKGFAYCNAYTAVDDFYENPLGETRRPVVGETGKYTFDMIDTCAYQWENRIQIYGPIRSRTRNLLKNRKAQALRQHKSQYVILRAGSIINSDEVFWLRRTDSVSYQAKITASSGEAGHLKDFRLYNCDEIDSLHPVFTDYLWQPRDEKKEAVFSWDEPQEISTCDIYGNIEGTGRITQIQLAFDNGFTVDAGPLPERGVPLHLAFPAQAAVSRCSVRIVEATGTGFGIAECEFYAGDNVRKIRNEIEAFSDEKALAPHENLGLAKAVNGCYFRLIGVRKLCGRAYWLINRKGLRGVVNKVLGKA